MPIGLIWEIEKYLAKCIAAKLPIKENWQLGVSYSSAQSGFFYFLQTEPDY